MGTRALAATLQLCDRLLLLLHSHVFPDAPKSPASSTFLLVGVFTCHFPVVAIIVFSLSFNPITVDNYSYGSVKCEQLHSLEREESYLKAKHDPENSEA